MASKHLLVLVILVLVNHTLQDVADNKVDSKDESPLADITKEILKEKNLENVGGMVNNFIQSGGAKQVIDGVLQNLVSGENAGQLLESLGSLLNSAGDEKDATKEKNKKKIDKANGDVNPMELLSEIGSLVGALQGAGGKKDGEANPAALLQGLGSLLGGGNNQGEGTNAAALLQGLGSLLGSATEEKGRKENNDDSGANILQGLGSIIGSVMANQGGGENNGGALLQGLGSLLGSGQGGQGGINPEMIGNMISMFANSQKDGKKDKKASKVRKPINEQLKSKTVDKPKAEEDASLDLAAILNIASSLFNQGGSGNGKSTGSFMDYLPMIINTISAFTGPEAQERAFSHSEHSWILPPVLEKIHVYYDNFLNSEMGKYLLSSIGEQAAFQIFRDEKGDFIYDKFESLIENHSFRKHWIQQLVGQLIGYLQMASDDKTYNQYYDMGIMFTNSFLKKSGFPKKTFIDPRKPARSLTNLANYAVKKYLDTDVNAREYVEPAVLYIQDIFKMARKSLIKPGAQPKELTDKLTNTINMDIIEPITRVNRAFRFTKVQPKCDKYVLCLINQEVTNDSENLPNIKKALYKGSSLIAGWFISSNTGTPYLDLYAIVTENKNCKVFYQDTCAGFHEEEIKATTEYVHNEL